ANQLTITLPDEPTASTLLSIKLNEYENALNTALGGSNQLLQSQERIAVISLLYTMSDSTSAAISNAIPSTITAIRHDNRAEAWFEIRYNSNRNGIHANRRYDESDLFGLLDSGAFTVEGTKEVFRMFTKHQSEISAYESAYPPPSSSSIALYTQVQLAKDYLVNQFGRGKSIDEIIVGAGLQSYAYLEKWTIDKIFGTDGNDLIFGEDYFLMRRAA
ncbi:MAG: hypothetical protein QMD44_06185, partial [Thermodesulfovibrionales bacterium]|nr:hypothetical protein [Thermodesulfovibrionales bacterium]